MFGKRHVMRALVGTLIHAVSSSAPQARAAESCLSLEPAVESIVGTLVRKTFPGPPNYESIKAGDQAETGWYLALAQPICLVKTPRDESTGKDIAGVKLVQLIATHGEYQSHARLVGKKVKTTGTFFTAQTGHHHTPVLMQVITLEPTKH